MRLISHESKWHSSQMTDGMTHSRRRDGRYYEGLSYQYHGS